MKNKTWSDLWLKYEPGKVCGDASILKKYCLLDFHKDMVIVGNALTEWSMGLSGMLSIVPQEVGCQFMEAGVCFCRSDDRNSKAEGYKITEAAGIIRLQAADDSGLLYGVFHLLRLIATNRPLQGLDITCEPDNPLRMYNHWDNMDGSIERGYSGNSFFLANDDVTVDERTVDYARLVSSIGINGVVINNVNVDDKATRLITSQYLNKVSRLAAIFAGYGIRLFVSLNFASPWTLDGPKSADPLDGEVISWWKGKMEEVFSAIPHLGGFLVKADSEGRPGPFTYGRTQADGVNMLADIVKPYGAVIIWRCFVYNCTQDWRDVKTDRARAGYDNFIEMDGAYHENVILQIKNGPMDFQVREPVSPLLGGLAKTNQMLEVQAAQEYTGHQIDVCYLIPLFKEVLDFKTFCADRNDTVADIVSGRTFGHVHTYGSGRTLGNIHAGIAAVSNTGNDDNWTGNDLAAANFYGFGRLAFSTGLSSEEIAEEWIRMTLSNEEQVVETVKKILLGSRSTYEKYTAPLGIGWMVNPHIHYGPSVDGYEYSRWGTYHRADHLGIGVDRSDSGTGYVRQYHEPNASRYNDMDSCPEELLLFFHHVPYGRLLKSGRTVIQHIYDSHFEGVEEVREMIVAWESLQGLVNEKTYSLVRERFQKQLANAEEWRDQVNTYFLRKSGIPDEKGRKIY